MEHLFHPKERSEEANAGNFRRQYTQEPNMQKYSEIPKQKSLGFTVKSQ
jgi:hypothetical protein